MKNSSVATVQPMTHSPEGPDPAGSRLLVARFGSFILVPNEAPVTADDAKSLLDRVAHALESDPRVLTVEKPEFEGAWTNPKRFYPSAAGDDGSDALLYGTDAFESVQLSGPLTFTIQVPKKNQRVFWDADEAPSERYLAQWDGVVLIVSWAQGPDDHIPMAGGHVAWDILRDAAHVSDGCLYVQACDADCRYGFAHTTMRVMAEPDIKDAVFQVSSLTYAKLVDVFLPDTASQPDLADALFHECRLNMAYFTELKNIGRRILDIENATRSDLQTLLIEPHQHALLGEAPLRSLPERWRRRHWRRDLRTLTARLWLELSNLETLKREWSRQRFRFEQDARNMQVLFDVDYGNDRADLESLDVSLMWSAVEQAAARLDNRAVVVATWGALGGALAGVVTSVLF